jgi:hypothetical protein
MNPPTVTRRCRLVLTALFLLSFCTLTTMAQVVGVPLTIKCPTNFTVWSCNPEVPVQYPPPEVSGGCREQNVVCQPPSGSVFPLGETVVLCRVVDSCQNIDTCRFIVTVRRDTEPPVIQCPSNRVVRVCPTAAGGCGAAINYPLPGATDNSGSVAVVCNPPSGSFFPCGVNTVTCRAEDRCGNKDECSFTITVEPGQLPGIQCPADLTLFTCSNSAVVVYPAPVVNPAGTAVQCFPPSGTSLALGSHSVTCIASNVCGTAQCSFKVEVRPVPPPSIVCPTNAIGLTVPCGTNCVPVTYPAPVVSNGTLVGCNPPRGTCLPVGIHTITCVATNLCGDRDVCRFEVRIIEGQGQPPRILCPDDIVVTTCSNCVPVLYPAPIVNNGALLKCDPPPGFCFPLGVTTVSCIATNPCDTAECKFTVTVRPVPPPSIVCPTNAIVLTVPCGTNCVPVAYPAPVVSNGTLVGCNPPRGTCLPVGVHTVTCVATNVCGERDTCRFEVRVIEGQGEPPIIRCPQDMVVVACSNECAVVHYPAPIVVNGALVKCDPPPGSCLPPGVHTIRCEASNACATAECKFTVTVLKDDPNPKLSIKRDGRFVVICWPKTCACYKLQSTRDLNPPILWTDVAQTPDDAFDSWCVRLPIDQRHRFFRLIKCDQRTAPIYNVLETGITRGQAAVLAESLGIPPGDLVFDEGMVRFVDPRKFQAVPTRPVQDQGIIDELRRNSQGEEEGEMVFEAFDFPAIHRLIPMDGDRAVDVFQRAIRRAGIGPKPEDPATIGPRIEDPLVRHTTLEALDLDGRPLADNVKLDTHVLYQFDLGGIPLTGPGSNLRASFGPGGDVTSLHVSMRKLQLAGEIPIISIDEAARRCAQRYPNLGGSQRPRLVYHAPEPQGILIGLLLPAVQKIMPCYECGGDTPAGGRMVSLLQTIIPATDDPDLIPTVLLEASAQGNLVNAKATVRGGTPPYTFQWSSSSVDLGGFPADASSIEYEARPRGEEKTDTVRVIVLDANGVPVSASKTVEIDGGAVGPLFTAAVGGVVDYGTERAVSDMGSGIQSGFNSRMSGGGAFRRFNFTGLSCWERDFKQSGNGLDHVYNDNVDLTFYIGHGYGGGFTFESSQNDGELYYTDAIGAWGNGDQEWLALTSCQVLKDTYGGKKWYDRWIPDFDGLHIMLGFETNAHDWSGFGYAFADWMHGKFGILPPMRVRDAWFLAKAEQQPAADIAVAIGVIGPGGCHNMNDYFHGRGPVGPDIRKNQVQGCWRLNFQ